MKKNVFSKKELMFICTLGFALGIRQMAMTMVMPFISVYSKTLAYSTPVLAGVALGIFGLMQAFFQIPFGVLSDKFGNKKIILIGLMQVIIGLLLAYFAKNIYLLIVARALQGSGAIIAVGYSWISSSVHCEKRTRAISIVGIILGFAATASFALGPIIHKYVSVNNMFLYCAFLILFSWIIILIFLREEKSYNEKETNSKEEYFKDNINTKEVFQILLRNNVFVKLNIAAFLNNFIIAAVFFAIPQYLENITGIDGMWKVFIPSVLIAIVFMIWVVKFSEKGYGIKLLILSFAITALGMIFYFNKSSFIFILIGTILFMTGYICICTLVPSLANDIAEERYRGTANGIVNSFQYIGSFVGSVIMAALWVNYEKVALILLVIVCILGIIMLKYCN
ncbi:MFS transporter [Clostridium botulinum]|uniref:MFS transporter n=1 Tax=Clostridium botulinum TaxID=1491 RepID=A0A846JEZ5_CLOBO|nr:MFS transporter [Clostridium botulinum]ACA55660.1 major facilitator family protein [Clostridium botulinum A3 str. Loch Maree]NFH67649.1 MFS transporter [Clostridium botulinum]NFJ10433.1 MFS transporter [Clostridium botulinum]NFK15289.1 MFS transporter [Clostridium botulinum]NFM95953.1 MFS transporter [Clostridium botulinum]